MLHFLQNNFPESSINRDVPKYAKNLFLGLANRETKVFHLNK